MNMPLTEDARRFFRDQLRDARYIAGQGDSRQVLRQPIEALCDSGRLVLEDAPVVRFDASVQEALEKSGGKPVLVIEGGRLAGIATPFDLL
jgi:hypothetical protein